VICIERLDNDSQAERTGQVERAFSPENALIMSGAFKHNNSKICIDDFLILSKL
jgi:hypothetical protein